MRSRRVPIPWFGTTGCERTDAIQLAAALTCKETIATLGADALFAMFDLQFRDAALAAGLDTRPA